MLTTLEWILLFNSLTIVIAPWVYPNSRLPRPTMAMAVGSLNHTIFLLGGNPSPRQMTKYHTESDSFVYAGGNALPINTSAMGQGWTQQGNILYLVDYDASFKLVMYHLDTQQFTTNWTDASIEIGSSACLASSNDTLFVVGGYCNTTSYHNKLQILNLDTLQWTNNAPSMNDARTEAACIVANGYLWAFGGLDANVQLVTNERVELNNITQNAWVYIDSLTTAITGLRAVLYKDNIYLIGGNAGMDWYDIVHVIDAQTGALTRTDHLPFQTTFSSPIVVHDVLYVFGGQTLLNLDKWAYFNLSRLTTNPSTAPSNLPTSGPSTLPTSGPSQLPTSGPSKLPTSGPSYVPTSGPSKVPTSRPSKIPTSGPSNLPTAGPSQWPSSNPSLNPSIRPSVSPIETTVVLLFNETYAKNMASVVSSTVFNAAVKNTQIQITYIALIAAAGVFLCVILSVLVYKKHNKTLAAQYVVNDDDDEAEKGMIKTWLTDIVKLPQYYSLFVDNGYNSLLFISEMNDKSELRGIGITLQGHQARIMREINRLNEKTMREKGEESLSEDVDDEESILHDNDVEDDEGNVVEVIAGGKTLGEGDAIEPPNPTNDAINAMKDPIIETNTGGTVE
eukprot:653760_1